MQCGEQATSPCLKTISPRHMCKEPGIDLEVEGGGGGGCGRALPLPLCYFMCVSSFFSFLLSLHLRGIHLYYPVEFDI